MNKIISDALMAIVRHCITTQTPFTLVLNNHGGWDKPLPVQLKEASKFMVNMVHTDLSDSHINQDGDIVIVIGIDDVVYTKVLVSSDVNSAGLIGEPMLITKHFDETPASLQDEPVVYGLRHSMECFKKNNPHLFKD